ncbi:hypothetical protein ES703_77662 [subsurface metagenome]
MNLSEIQTRHVLKMKKNLEQIAKEYGRFSPPGIKFVYEALGFTVKIVWLMIKHKWMSAQPADSIDDFNDVYDFKTVFKDQFEF